MRVFTALIVALGLVIMPISPARSQTFSDAPRNVDQIPGYPNLYVADAGSFMAGAFLLAILTRPRDVRAFLAPLDTCASNPTLAQNLRNEGLRTSVVNIQQAFTALASGDCAVFIGSGFDIRRLDNRFDSEGEPPDDVGRPTQDDNAPQDEFVVDRTPPDITPFERIFENTGRAVTVRATIIDRESAIREAYVTMADGTRLQMTPAQDGTTFAATVALPRNFDDEIITLVATNTANRSNEVRAAIRLLPWCGPRAVVSQSLVQDVQTNLACVGISAGTPDGALGPNTCSAIGSYLDNRMSIFDAGRIRWETLQQELARACLAVQPVVLDMPNRVEVDSDRTNVRISLTQPGLTEAIIVAGGGDLGQQTLEWRGQPLFFEMAMPQPGQTAAYRVVALGPDRNTLDSAPLQLIRPSAVLSVQPSGTATATAPNTDFAVTVTRGASAIALIEARLPDANPVNQQYQGGTTTLSLPSPEPGESQTVTFVALDRGGNALAQQSITFSGPTPIVPTRLAIDSPDGETLDANSVRVRVVLETPGAATTLVLRGGPDMAELASTGTDEGVWETTHPLPPPGEAMTFMVLAFDRANELIADDRLRVTRAPIAMQVQPSGMFEAETESMTAQITVSAGVDWIRTIIARDSRTGSILGETALTQGQAALSLDMPEAGNTQTVEIVAVGRDDQPHAPAQITLARPAIAIPVALVVTSPDGFAIDAENTRLAVHIANPADTAMIVVSDPGSGQVFQQVRYTGDDWLGQVTMPAPGQDRAVLIEARNLAGDTLADAQIMLLRPAAVGLPIPGWVWIGALALGAIGIGYLGAKLSGKSTLDTKVPPPRPRVYAQSDEDPEITLAPASPPTIVLRIEPDDVPDTQIEMEHRNEQ